MTTDLLDTRIATSQFVTRKGENFGDYDLTLFPRPPRSPDLTRLIFFSWGSIKDLVEKILTRAQRTHQCCSTDNWQEYAAKCME
ncbi:hypothetical protein TNCV_117451 [Trichonephila clavipes]|nr:hypothetical protein TNCV_117451 [Trichonephila clavipes]